MIHHNKLKVWLPPGGHVDDNELPDDAVLREIFEETGIKAKIIINKRELALSSKHCRELEIPFIILLEDIRGDRTHNHIDMVYLREAINEDLVMQETEIHGIVWFTIEQLDELETFDNVIKTIFKAVDFINSYN